MNAAHAALHDVLRRELERGHLEIAFRKRLDRVTDLARRPNYQVADRPASKPIGADGLHPRVRVGLMSGGPTPGYTGLHALGGVATSS